MPRRFLIALAISLLTGGGQQAEVTTHADVTTQTGPSYGVTELGWGVVPAAMTESGFPQLAGSGHFHAANQSHGFSGAVGYFTTLGTLGGTHSVARATNGSYSVGQSNVPGNATHAFIADYRGQMTDMGTLGGVNSYGFGINDEGVAVGFSEIRPDLSGGPRDAFIYRDGVMSSLGATLGGPSSGAYDINNHGQVVGYADLPGTGGGGERAILHQDGVTHNLGTLGGRSIAFAINDSGVVVGNSMLPGTLAFHAFRWDNGVMQDLGTLGGARSHAAAINDSGVIAGWAENAQGEQRAVIWRDGVIIDLNTLVAPGTDWTLVAATGIGFQDAVIGWGRRSDSEVHGFLLTPPFDVELTLSKHGNEVDTNRPNPYEVGNLLLGVSVWNWGDFAATGVTIRDQIEGPIEYVGWSGGACVQDGQSLTCTVAPFEMWARDIMIQTRATGPGPIRHSAAIVRGEHLDTNRANDSASETNTAVSIDRLDVTKTHVKGGQSVLSRVHLTSPAPGGGARVRLASSHPDIASVPAEFDVLPWAYGGMYREFYVTTKTVSAPVTVQISATYGQRTRTVPLTVMPEGSWWPAYGTPWPIPGDVQAEDFDEGGQGAGYYDTTPGNTGGAYRNTDVDIEPSKDSSGYNVGWMAVGEWLGYSVNVQTAGSYRLDLRVAANGAGGRVHVEFDGVDKTGAMTIPNTGGWQSWTTISAPVSLSAGPQRMRVLVAGAGPTGVVGNLNYIRLVSTGPASTPYTGTPIALPGVVQAENFDNGGAGVAYHDTTAGNSGGFYRATDVDIQATTDAGGGYNVGWMAPGEWLAYTVNVAQAATYRLDVRVAANGQGGRFHIEFDGVDKTGPMTIPATGGWQSWYTLHTNVALNAGIQRMRVVVDSAGPTGVVGNINYVQVISQATTPTPTNIVLYATDVPASSMYGSWRRVVDSTTPGMRLETPDAGVAYADRPLAAPVDYFEVTFKAAANQPYAIWLRMKALGNSKWNDAVWVQFSGAHAGGAQVYPIGSTSGLLVNLATDAGASSLQNWGWQNGAYWLAQHTTLTFPAGGVQTLRIQTREDGAQIDQIILSPSAYRTGPPGARSNDTTIVAKPSNPYP